MKEISHIRQLVKDLSGQIAPADFTEEELTSENIVNSAEKRTYAIETEGINIPIKVDEESDKSEFRFFEDARQRTIQVGYLTTRKLTSEIRVIPIHYYAVGAVILKREGKKLALWGEPLIETGLVIHKSSIADVERINHIETLGVNVLDTSKYEHEEINYYLLKQWALQIVKDQRQAVEEKLIERWYSQENTGDFLVLDGSLINLRGEAVKRCISVSKSSRMEMDHYNKIIELKERERSWSFSFHDEGANKSEGVRPRVSWYMRLREKLNSDPEFGLIKPEIHESHKAQATELAERLSKSLFLERLPTSYAEGNWDKTLYPISVCKKYLNNIMPSIRSVKSIMKI